MNKGKAKKIYVLIKTPLVNYIELQDHENDSPKQYIDDYSEYLIPNINQKHPACQ